MKEDEKNTLENMTKDCIQKKIFKVLGQLEEKLQEEIFNKTAKDFLRQYYNIAFYHCITECYSINTITHSKEEEDKESNNID